MKLTTTFAVALLALVLVPQALAGPRHAPVRAAVAACKAEAKEIGREAFKAAYGHRALRNCVRLLTADAREALRAAAKACREEWRAGREAFLAKYGVEGRGPRAAFLNCVKQTSGVELADEISKATNAATECREEYKADPAGFREKYGQNGNKRNAFGKCVSQKAGDRGGEPAPETPAP